MPIERRPHGAEAEALDHRTRLVPPHQVGQQRGDQRAVHDQAGIALLLRHVLAVIVDAVAVEGERAVAEQQHVVGHDPALPGCRGLGGDGRRRLGARLRRGDIDDVVLKDRKTLSQDGLVVAVLTIDSETGRMLAAPEIVSRGFVYMRDSEELIADTKALLVKETRKFEGADRSDYANIKAGIKNSLKSFLKNRTKRTPMIMPIIIEI